MKKVVVKKNRYVDSVSLMGVSERVTAMQGVENAEAQMATCANKDVLKMLGYELPEAVSPNDLVIAITADNEEVRNIVDVTCGGDTVYGKGKRIRSYVYLGNIGDILLL